MIVVVERMSANRIAEVDTDFDNIRDDPRFAKVIAEAKKRAGIAETVATG